MGDELEWKVEAARSHDLDERLDARRDHALFPARDHRTAAAAAGRELVLAQAGAQARFPDEVAASHRPDSMLDVAFGY